MSHNSNCCCPTNCGPCYLNTNIILKDLSSCEGIFSFGPDNLTIPGPCGLTGPNTKICPLDVNVLENCKGDYKITILDDNGCNLACILLRCSQFEIIPLSDLSDNIAALYEANLPTGYSQAQIVQINANNLNLVGEYVAFEEAAYFHRQVTQSYLNLWCGAEQNGIVCQILENVDAAVDALNIDFSSNAFNSNTDQTITSGNLTIFYDARDLSNASIRVVLNQPVEQQTVYVLGQDLLKARVLALKQLCECGKVCNDQFFPRKVGPCQALKGCCPPRHR